MTEIINSFKAFNINGFSNLGYVLISNWWYLLICLAAIASMIMYIKSEADYSVREEQQVL